MRAVTIDPQLKYQPDHPMPDIRHGEALIRVRSAGICQTDLELLKGYMGFRGIPGHEFVGSVEKCDDPRWIGKKVVGEINAGCGKCAWCRTGLERHCPTRSVLGILAHDGCMADWCRLPVENLHRVPNAMTDDQAVFIEPLSAACEILNQLSTTGDEKVLVLGDGRLGILCAWVMTTVANDVTLIGHHRHKLKLAAWRGLKTVEGPIRESGSADLVIEATGTGAGLSEAISLCRPRGTIVLKSTVAEPGETNLAPIVINEITVVGSRCGLFREGLSLAASHPDLPLDRLITSRYPIEQAARAFAHAGEPGALKVLLDLT